jgi:6-phosphogluconolactonase
MTMKDSGQAASEAAADVLRVYVGTYTRGGSKGIYAVELDVATGSLSAPEPAAEVANPSFLAAHPSGRLLYAVGELSSSAGGPNGAVSAFGVDPRAGTLTPLNQQPSGGAGPCHLTVDRDGRHVLVANYGSGSVGVLPIGRDGRLAEPSCVVQHVGSGPNPRRQAGPHAHSVNLDPAGRFAFVADLGLDKVMIYRFNAADGTLTANDPPAATVAPGAGPRHLAFDPAGQFAYVINEMAATVTAFAFDASRGALREVQTVSTLPPDFTGENSTAEVAVHPSGRFCYGSNRGHDSLALFAIDGPTGRLTGLGQTPTRGREPRHFAIDPTGTWLLAANQNSDSLVVFGIDPQSGLLQPTDSPATVPCPVCVRFMPPVPVGPR